MPAAAKPASEDVRFFASPAALRRWLLAHGAREPLLWLGMHRKESGLKSVTYHEALDEALCVGWIDGVRYRLDDTSFVQRFTPRTARSRWSAVNIKRYAGLLAAGRVTEAGERAYAARNDGAPAYPHEAPEELSGEYARQLRADEAACAFFNAQAPWYQRAASTWVMSAKREETRARRIATLIADSAAGQRIRPLSNPNGESRRVSTSS